MLFLMYWIFSSLFLSLVYLSSMKMITIMPTNEPDVVLLSISDLRQKGDKNSFKCSLSSVQDIVSLNIK